MANASLMFCPQPDRETESQESRMSRQSLIASLTFIALSAGPTIAADLAHQSPLGAVFAESRPRIIVRDERSAKREVLLLPIKVPGYYGGFDTTYRNYYGTSPVTIFTRLPYACKWHGLC